jgi:uncharacterized protein (TIRG00374 family)
VIVSRIVNSWWLRLIVTVAILAYLSRDIDMASATRAVLRVDKFYLALVLFLVACDRGVMILRWMLLLRASDSPVRVRDAARIFLVSSFVGSFLPAGVGGDMARAYGLSRVTAERSEALASVAIDRVLGVVALLSMGIAGLLAGPAELLDWRLAVLIALLLAASLAVFWADWVVDTCLPRLWRGHHLSLRASKLARALGRYRSRPSVVLHVFTWSVSIQFLRVVQAYFLGLGLNLLIPFRYYLVFMPIGLLMLLLPISVSGFGLPQGVIVWLMRPLGVAEEQSFALSTLIILTGLAGNMPGVVLWLRRRTHSGVRG